MWSTSAQRPDSEACLYLHIQVQFKTRISIDIFYYIFYIFFILFSGSKYFRNTFFKKPLREIHFNKLSQFIVIGDGSVVSIYNLICAFYHQPQHSAQWSCVRTTRVWPLTSALWELSPPTTSPFNSGHLSRILPWVTFIFPMEKINTFTFHLKQITSPQVRDYSGTYTVKLLPCTSPPSLEYAIPPVCNPREPLTFDMDIRFQQVKPH